VQWFRWMVDRIVHAFLHLDWRFVLALVFALPLLEASTLIGLVIPGELTMILAGVLASYGRVSFVAVALAGSVGAVLGDSIGYWVGKRWGDKLLRGWLGRLVGERRWSRAQHHLRRRGFLAVALGRFLPGLRTLAPGAAGMAGMPYRRFFAANVIGGAGWAFASVLAGWLAGSAWRQLATVEHVVTIVLLLLVAGGVAVAIVLRNRREVRRAGGRTARARPDPSRRGRSALHRRWLRRPPPRGAGH
jgi:membrane protein DedA with SNARE-associated domain